MGDAAFEASGVITMGDRSAANLGFACSCAANSAGLTRYVGGCCCSGHNGGLSSGIPC